MNYSVGIWAHGQVPNGVVYRWEADGGTGGNGFVLLETATKAVRPCDSTGRILGTLAVNADTGDLTGETSEVDRTAFLRTAAAIIKRFLATGTAPETAHSYFG